jgi:hypothetical protein
MQSTKHLALTTRRNKGTKIHTKGGGSVESARASPVNPKRRKRLEDFGDKFRPLVMGETKNFDEVCIAEKEVWK